ncbi:MAG: prolipoprotein diacylglyceryl transferase [Ignavibacteriaceae bacterium]|nr:prolipoprotein diacylglyceryl transferase [Ignavibacteriaceae bacterium]
MHPVIHLFDGFAINSYSLFTALGAAAFAVVCYREARRLSFPIDSYWRLFFMVAVFAIIGGKLAAAIFFGDNLFFKDPIKTFTDSGWMFYGAAIGGYAALFAGRALFQFPLMTALDGMSYGGVIGLGIGRIGCFLGGCCGGLPTDSFAGMTFPGGACAVHPTQLYESGFALLLFSFITFARKKVTFEGFQIAAVLIGYSVFRFLVEFIRDDSLRPGFKPFTPSQYISIVIFITGLIILIIKSGRIKAFSNTESP